MAQSLAQEPANKALALVAHPDDCVIFAKNFIHYASQFDWHICYLTYKELHPRAIEAKAYWSTKNIGCTFLGYPDDYGYVKQGQLGFDPIEAKDRITEIVKPYDLILTHNSVGEYGHIHHLFVHNSLIDIDKPKVYFGHRSTSNLTYSSTEPVDMRYWKHEDHMDTISAWGIQTKYNIGDLNI